MGILRHLAHLKRPLDFLPGRRNSNSETSTVEDSSMEGQVNSNAAAVLKSLDLQAPTADSSATAATPTINEDAASDLVATLVSHKKEVHLTLFRVEGDSLNEVEWRGEVFGIGEGHASVQVSSNESKGQKMKMRLEDHEAAIAKLLELMQVNVARVKAVGHRVVNGGEKLTQPLRITPDVKKQIKMCFQLAPDNNPGNLMGIEAAQKLFGTNCYHVAVFESAFSSTMEPATFMFALPYDLYTKYQIRRYGNHGISYQTCLMQTSRILNRDKSEVNAIMIHLTPGGQNSMCCVRKGQCVDVTMGLTPFTSGLTGSTAVGDVDPMIGEFLEETGMSQQEVKTMLQTRSGLVGICGLSDISVVLQKAAQGDKKAILARDMFVHGIRKYLGAYLLQLQGMVDAVVFTGRSADSLPELRSLICKDMDRFGVILDAEKNRAGQGAVQTQTSFTKILVLPHQEDQALAQICQTVVKVTSKRNSVRRTNTLYQNRTLTSEISRMAKKITQEDKLNISGHNPLGERHVSSLYIHEVNNDERSGTVLLNIGAVHHVLPYLGSDAKVGFFKPIAYPRTIKPSGIETIRSIFQMKDEVESMYGLTTEELDQLVLEGKREEAFSRILESYMAYKEDKDFVVIGSQFLRHDNNSMHFELARMLDAPMVLNHQLRKGETKEDIEADLKRNVQEARDAGANIIGVMVNRIPDSKYESVSTHLKAAFKGTDTEIVALLHLDPALTHKYMNEVLMLLDGKMLSGSEENQNPFNRVVLGGSTPAELTKEINEASETLVVLDASDSPAIHSALLTHLSTSCPPLAGILLYGSTSVVSPETLLMLEGLQQQTNHLPVLKVNMDLQTVIGKINDMKPQVYPSSYEKIDCVLNAFSTHLSPSFWKGITSGSDIERIVSPRMFHLSCVVTARSFKQRLLLPEGDNFNVVLAAKELQRRNLAQVILLETVAGTVAKEAQSRGVDLMDIQIINPQSSVLLAKFAKKYQELESSKAKGLTLEAALERCSLVDYFAAMMLQEDMVDAVVGVSRTTTVDALQPALEIVKLREGVVLSSVFFMMLPKYVYVYGDCAIADNPTSKELGQIAADAATTASYFGILPRVALLSYATGDSNKGPMITKVKEATQGALEASPGTFFEGPMQFDAAVDPSVAKQKVKGHSEVAGRANVLIYPDVATGNNAYKAVKKSSGCNAIGPIVQGLTKPVNVTVRHASVDDIVNTALITIVQAIKAKAAL